MKNCESVKTVNVILLDDYGSEIQTRNFLHSACQQKDVNVNIKGKIDDKITKDYLSYLTFYKKTEGLTIYHSPRIILGQSDIYKYLLDNPKQFIVPLRMDQIIQKYYPYIPNFATCPVKNSSLIVETELCDFEKSPKDKICYYQN